MKKIKVDHDLALVATTIIGPDGRISLAWEDKSLMLKIWHDFNTIGEFLSKKSSKSKNKAQRFGGYVTLLAASSYLTTIINLRFISRYDIDKFKKHLKASSGGKK